MSKRQLILLRAGVNILALLPLAVLIWNFTQGKLGVNPVREVQLYTGDTAINLLMLSLACTTVYILSGFRQVLLLRRPLGIYAFIYALLHLVNFIGIDYGFNFQLIREDLFEKRYAIAGLISFLLLLPLAITSFNRLRQKLGSNWRRLHWLVYSAAALAVIHYIWQTKAGLFLPLTYAAALAIMLVIRLPISRTFASRHFPWLKR